MILEWLAQELTVPLYGFLIALLLPAAFFARVAKSVVEDRVNALAGGSSKD